MAKRPIRRAVRAAWRILSTGVLPSITALSGYLQNPRQVVRRVPAEGAFPLGPRVAVFCHYDAAGEVRARVLAYLDALRGEGFSIVFVSNAGQLTDAAMRALLPRCAGVVVRRNVGYDFGAWRDALEQAALPRPDTAMLLLLNDSVFGPLQPIGPLLRQIDFDAADIWGLTESWQTGYHLQSYFYAIAPSVLRTPTWRRFWAGVRPVPSKHSIIHAYEVGFTRDMLRGGLRCRALFAYSDLIAAIPTPDDHPPIARVLADANARRLREKTAREAPLNPTSDLWRELLGLGYPFIKRELLRDNPARVPDVVDWQSVVAPTGDKAAIRAIIDELGPAPRAWPRRRPGDRRRRSA
jgi:hypothetical protein